MVCFIINGEAQSLNIRNLVDETQVKAHVDIQAELFLLIHSEDNTLFVVLQILDSDTLDRLCSTIHALVSPSAYSVE